MAIKRYVASSDNTITNAYKSNLINRGTGSNMGLSDILEVFSLYAQASSSAGLSQELSRILLKFPISQMITDRTNDKIPASGSVSFYLKMFNATHAETLPRNAIYNITPITKDWEEGNGLDMETYLDETRDGSGSNWINSAKNTTWTTVGGDYDFTSSTYYTQSLQNGYEDIEIDVTVLAEQWLTQTRSNFGLGIHLTASHEAYYSSSNGSNTGSILHNVLGSQESYYTKKFFARGSEHYFKRPILEARWNSSEQDDRGNVYFSSSLMTAEDNLNTLYLYNYARGRLRDIPGVGTGKINVSLYSGSTTPTGSQLLNSVGGGVVTDLDTNITGGWVSTGIYTASFAVTASSSPLLTVFDIWHSGSVEYYTGSFEPKRLPTTQFNPNYTYYSTITNLKDRYSPTETARFRVYNREKNWTPTIYDKANATPENNIIVSGAYEITRISDNLKVVGFGTGSLLHTKFSYDVSGNYFDFDMGMLEPDYAYGIKLAYYNDVNQSWQVQNKLWKFRVEE